MADGIILATRIASNTATLARGGYGAYITGRHIYTDIKDGRSVSFGDTLRLGLNMVTVGLSAKSLKSNISLGRNYIKQAKQVEAGGHKTKGGSKTISYTEYDNIYQSSIQNAGKDKVMLGKYDGGGSTSYITKAGSEYEYFSLGKDWDAIKAQYGYTDNDMFKLFNESFLDDGINAGKTFQFSHNPVGDKGALAMEFKYLKENNYIWDSTTLTMRPR